jgi:hypothetical protein
MVDAVPVGEENTEQNQEEEEEGESSVLDDFHYKV